MADVHSKLDELTSLVEQARAMPLSASCVLHRGELLAAIDEIRELLPAELAAASGVLRDRADVLAQGRSEAQTIIDEALVERERLVSRTEVVAQAQVQAQALIDDAQAQARTMRLEVEDYVDGKLANFEVVLHKTISAVQRGRDRLRSNAEQDQDQDDAPASEFGGAPAVGR